MKKNNNFKMFGCYGNKQALEIELERYLREAQMAPGMIQSLHLSGGAGVALTLLHRVNSKPNQKYIPCWFVIVEENSLGQFTSKVEFEINRTSDQLLFSAECETNTGLRYWVGIFSDT